MFPTFVVVVVVVVVWCGSRSEEAYLSCSQCSTALAAGSVTAAAVT